MRLVVTSDLHYDIARSQEPTRRLAEAICGLRADALLILGDVGGRDPGILEDCLRLFDRFGGRKLFVAGNHDIWTLPGQSSLDRLRRELPAICDRTGFHALDVEPAVIGGVGFAGTMGWYDYGYRPRWLEIPLRFYEAKVAPGAAARLPEFRHLLEDDGDVPESAMQLGVRWMDGEHVRLPMGDPAFCRELCDGLADQLDSVSRRCSRIVVGTHHVPARVICPVSDEPRWAFAATYMGAEMFGDVIRGCSQVRYAFSGHSHRGMCARGEQVTFVNVGSTYIEKYYALIDV